MEEPNARMGVCRECLGLRGPCFDEFSRCERVQRCRCEPPEPLWRAYDFNTAAELCRGCGSVVIRSGSRWSLFFCEACKERVVAHNRAYPCDAIPIGRHSIMNSVPIDAFAGLSERIDRLTRHHDARVRTVVHGIEAAQVCVPIAVYLARAASILEPPAEAIEALAHAVATS